ncbi:MAG: hypothetical protein JNM55_20255 [Anaerolineales bacterium]|nr:hypothetical protein [Anaerolineales bacterium]
MLRKIFLALFGLFIVTQAVGVFAWGNYLHSQTKAEIISEGLPTDILVDSKGQLWVQPWAATYSQDFKWEVYKNGNKEKTFDIKNEPNFPTKIAMDLQGNLFGALPIGNSGIRVVTYDGSSWNELTEFTREYTPLIDVITVASRDDIWIAGSNQLIHYNGTEWETFTSENSPLPNGYIYSIFTDSRKRVWIGTLDGVAMIDHGDFQSLPDSALSGIYIYSFAEGRDGTIWAGGNGSLYSFDGAQWTVYNSKNSKLHGSQINDIEVDASNRVWALSSEGHLSILDGTTTKYLFGEPGDTIENIEIDSGILYIMRANDVGMLRTDMPLLSLITLKFLWLLNNGVFVYLSMFLVIVWIAVAMKSWGIGLGLTLGGLTFWGLEISSLFDVNGVPLGYINPGFALTIFTFIGGLIGYFFKRRGAKYADAIGSGIGCVGGGILLTCAFIIFMMGLMALGG